MCAREIAREMGRFTTQAAGSTGKVLALYTGDDARNDERTPFQKKGKGARCERWEERRKGGTFPP